MKTPEEIKKGLECCTTSCSGCDGCPYNHDGCGDNEEMTDALAYIKQLEAKNAEYEKAIEEGRMVMLPCKPGDDLYWLAEPEEGVSDAWHVKCDKRGVGAVVVRGKDDFALISKDNVVDNRGIIEEIGERWSYLTAEAAQAEIERMGTDV